MKQLLIPFLFLSTIIFAQNIANKVEKYKIDSELAYPFEKPLLGKVKKVHTALFYSCNCIERYYQTRTF